MQKANIPKYKVLIKKKAEKFLEKLSEPNYSSVKSAIISLSFDARPFRYKKLVSKDIYRIRVGDYRIIYEIFDDIVTIEVINIGHRKNVY